MEVKCIKEFAIASVDIRGINCKEMRQMVELNERIVDVLSSHKEEATKRQYVSDDDLKLMNAILSVFTEGFAETQTSAFDAFMQTPSVE